MNQPDPDTARVLNAHYDAARHAIHEHRTAHEGYRERERRARAAGDDDTAGREGACAVLAAREWDRALGAARALEQLADSLEVALANDRRPLIQSVSPRLAAEER